MVLVSASSLKLLVENYKNEIERRKLELGEGRDECVREDIERLELKMEMVEDLLSVLD